MDACSQQTLQGICSSIAIEHKNQSIDACLIVYINFG